MNVQFGEALQQMSWTPILGVAAITHVNPAALQEVLAGFQHPLKSLTEEALAPISRRMQAFESFFAMHGFHSPLTRQFEQTRKKGLPAGNAIVGALLLAEMSNGLLMGAQNLDSVKGDIIYDLANDGESFRGMRGEIKCRTGELVLRDSEGIIASLLQGPDFRTRLLNETRNVIFFVFSVPGIDAGEVRHALDGLQRIFVSAANETKCQIYCAAEAAERTATVAAVE